jgi:hypothetical protein
VFSSNSDKIIPFFTLTETARITFFKYFIRGSRLWDYLLELSTPTVSSCDTLIG